MSVEWRRRETTVEEDLGAVALAVGTGLVAGGFVYWLARTLMGRDAIETDPPARLPVSRDGRGLPPPEDEAS